MKLRKKEKRTLGILGTLTYFSGATLFILSRWVRVSSTVGDQHHPMEYWARFAHTLLTYLIVLSVGYLLKGHILPGLRSRTKKRIYSGLGTFSLFFILLSTALITLYGGESPWVGYVSLSHALVGLLCPLLIIFHSGKAVTFLGKLKKIKF